MLPAAIAQLADASTWLQIRPVFIGAGIVLFLLSLVLGVRALRARSDEAASVEEGFETLCRRVQGLDRLYAAAAVLLVGLAVLVFTAVAFWLLSQSVVKLGNALLYTFTLLAPIFLLFYLLRYVIQRPADSVLTKMVESSSSTKGAQADSPESLSRLVQTYRYYRDEKNLPQGVAPPALFHEIENRILEKISLFGMRYIAPFSKKRCALRTAYLAVNVLLLALLLIWPRVSLMPVHASNPNLSEPQTTSTNETVPEKPARHDETPNTAGETPSEKEAEPKSAATADSLNPQVVSSEPSTIGEKESSLESEATNSKGNGNGNTEIEEQAPREAVPALARTPNDEAKPGRKGEQQDQNETAKELADAVEQRLNDEPDSSAENEPSPPSGEADGEPAENNDESEGFLSWLKTLFSDDSKQTANAGKSNETSSSTDKTEGESSSNKCDSQPDATSTLAQGQQQAGNSASGQAGSTGAPTQNSTSSQEGGKTNLPTGFPSSYGPGTDPNLQGDPTYPPTVVSPENKEFPLATQSSTDKTKEVHDGKKEASGLGPRPARYNKLHALRPQDVTITPADPLLAQRIPKAYESTIKRLLIKHE